MWKDNSRHIALCLALLVSSMLTACGGSGESTEPPVANPPVTVTPPAPNPPPVTRPAVILDPPVLWFTDTGLSVSDGVTFNGKWSVNSQVGWEWSLDQGTTWISGVGDEFTVEGDGTKMIWVRARDEFGNTSPIVMVACVLDTRPPAVVAVSEVPQTEGITRTLQITGVEAGGRWEYSLDNQTTWFAGTGSSLGILGNGFSSLWLRQLDLAGNASEPQTVELEMLANDAWHEASGNPLQPSTLNTAGSGTFLIHGIVSRIDADSIDADYVRWDIPAGHQMTSVRLVRYIYYAPPPDGEQFAFYALQRAPVFDAGNNTDRMLSFDVIGQAALGRNLISAVPGGSLGEGAMTLRFQQTGPPTGYAIEVTIQPLP